MVSTFELIQVAFVTGIGAGIGNPIGQWFFKKYLENKLDKTHDKVQKVSLKIKESDLNIPSISTDEKIREMIGK